MSTDSLEQPSPYANVAVETSNSTTELANAFECYAFISHIDFTDDGYVQFHFAVKLSLSEWGEMGNKPRKGDPLRMSGPYRKKEDWNKPAT